MSDEEATIMTSSGTMIDRAHARLAAILRYRGMEAEALMATHLMNIESLVASIELVLDDLQSALGERPDFPDVTVEETLRNCARQAHGVGLDDAALRQLRLVESVLETALSHMRKSLEAACAHDRGQVQDGGGRDASKDDSAAFHMCGEPWSVNDVRGRNCCASHS